LRCARAQCCLLVLAAFAAAPVFARSLPTAEVTAVRVVPGDNGPVLAVTSTRPLTPQLQTVENPLRLVIDLPGSTLGVVRKHIPFRNQQIKSIRVNQYQSDPAVTRIVVDLAGPVRYTWDALGNQLNIRMRADEGAAAKPESVPALTAGVQPVAVPYAVGSSGSLVESGSRVASGASISAKQETAILRLTRGGEVRVCPGTTVSVATSPSGQDMMLGMSTGSVETHYHLEESSDSVLTPDFRIVLPGPGEFNLAIEADVRGDTCINSMAGSTSSVVVAELLGSGTYEIKPGQQVVFRRGRMESLESPLTSCGCPPPQEPVLRASADPGTVLPEQPAGSTLQLDNSTEIQGRTPRSDPSQTGPESRPIPHAQAGQMKVQVEAPLVFSGKARARAVVPPVPLSEADILPLTSRQPDPMPALVVLPPNEPKKVSKSFFGRVKGFFGSIFQ
jgi:hypothetical protein